MPAKPQTLYASRHLHLVQRHKWVYATRPGITGIVAVVAVTDDRKLILVEQHRPPLDRRVIELPAGLAGDTADAADEDLADAARRELLEETGYEAAAMERLAAGAPSAGLTDEIVTLYRATGLRRVTAGGGDASENITVHEIPLNQVATWLKAQAATGKLIDLKVYAGLYFAQTIPSPVGEG